FRQEQHEWNPHYQGCVWVGSKLFRTNCVQDCRERCARKPEAECALLHFAQGNAVKCTGGATNRNFARAERIRDCLPLIFSEIEILRPQVIVLQGRNRGTGHIHREFREEASRRGEWIETESEHVSVISWGGGQPYSEVVASFRHPS